MSGDVSLLSVDVDAEIRKLCAAQLESRAQVLVELVRLLFARGAVEVRLRSRFRSCEVLGQGARLPPETLAALGLIADPAADSSARHDAVADLDQRFGAGLLALTRLRCEVRVDGDAGRFEIGFGGVGARRHEPQLRRPWAVRLVLPFAAGSTELRQLRRACRFSARPVWSGGRRLDGDGGEDALLWKEVTETAGAVRVGLPRRDSLHRVVHLRAGIVVEEATRRATRLGPVLLVVDDEALAVHRHWDSQVAAWIDELYAELRNRYPGLNREQQSAGRELLFERSLATGDRQLLQGLPLFVTTDGAALDLEAVGALAADGLLFAVGPDEARPRRSHRPVLRVGDRERAVLARLLGVSLVPPPRLSLGWFGEVGWLQQTVRALGRKLRALFGPRARRPVAEEGLSDNERLLVRRLQASLDRGELVVADLGELSRRCRVLVVEGSTLPPDVRRRADGLWWELPRGNRLVQRAASAVARDERFVLPAAAALLDGRAGLRPATR